MNVACNSRLFWPRPRGPWGGVKRSKYHLISITKSISKIFIPNFVCVLTTERYKISDGIFILSPKSCPRDGTLGRWGCPGGSIFFIFKHGHVIY